MREWRYFGASVRGPAHAQDGQQNQDAWLGRANRNVTLVAVCDGMGSRAHADFGARAACLAVADAARCWAQAEGAPPELLLRAVHALWNIRVHSVGREECATTCLFAVASPDGRLVLAQLGDGLVAMLKTSGEFVTLEPSGDRFSNQTTGLGVATSLADWRLYAEPMLEPRTTILLATDGISEDLKPTRRSEFVAHLRNDLGSMPAAMRWRRLTRELRNWPVPHHRDDKTLALLWRGASAIGETT